MSAGLSLRELWSFVVMHHGALKGFARRNSGGWTKDVRRTAWTGLAVLASMIRRLIHLMAKDIVLAPVYPAEDGTPLPPLPGQSRPRLSFRLTESPREHYRRHQNPDYVPDTPEFDHARFLERLFICAAAYRARERLARRLARRVQTGRAPLRALPLPARLYRRTAAGFTNMLDHLDARLAAPPDTS
ncbi:MAG: hypothetical protein RLO80_01430 [Hyphomonas sp.]